MSAREPHSQERDGRAERLPGLAVIVTLATAAAAVGGCAATVQDSAELAFATRDVRAASESGAREDPQAGYFLELAERELVRAQIQNRLGDAGGARGWASRAQADAELARMMAIEAATRAAAQRTEHEAEALSRGPGAFEAR